MKSHTPIHTKQNPLMNHANTVVGVSLTDNHHLRTIVMIHRFLAHAARAILYLAGFFLFEVLKNLSVHPVQYVLVGVALAFFYLLLLSLSEHLGFGAAYGLSASACVLLIGFYLSHVLRSVWRGLGFAGGLAVLYAMLFGLLSAEDYALLMGSLLCFGLLGVFMVLTRRLDWSRVGRSA